MNNPFEYVPDEACEAAFGELLRHIELLGTSSREEDVAFYSELQAGKMLGVLIAEDEVGRRHTLYAFSGQVGNMGFYFPGFVEPVFDYLSPEGYFKTHERKISLLNREIADFERGRLAHLQSAYEYGEEINNRELAEFKGRCRVTKMERDARRKSGKVSAEEEAEMIRQSQFEKAELRRLKKRLSEQLLPLKETYIAAKGELEAMKEKRRRNSENLQRWLFDNFKLQNERGESRSLTQIFAATAIKVPPSGAGECCAPKLLTAAYRKGWVPISIAEYWYGKPKGGEVRRHGEYYPACRGKCLPVLNWMLQGLDVEPPLENELVAQAREVPEIIYENRWFCVVNKPSGMLSVPGKGSMVSVEEWLGRHYGAEKEVKMVHRLDQDTSGVIIAAFGKEVYKLMQSLFATRNVRKVYEATLEGDYRQRGIAESGRISLPLSADWLDRPRQRVDFESGKGAVTEYRFLEVTDGKSRVEFRPLTGRTHQLRVHSASEHGLGMPIAGDRLYGKDGGRGVRRLMLHAREIEFTFPLDGKVYHFTARKIPG
ncbi:MAG: RNA pseudouridine synthase [Muribaculaceae bacterium]|nr:RNA pseudouridine synthase [Muribaculaceae bacterium]